MGREGKGREDKQRNHKNGLGVCVRDTRIVRFPLLNDHVFDTWDIGVGEHFNAALCRQKKGCTF